MENIKEITLKVTNEEFAVIGEALEELPVKRVKNLMKKLYNQFMEQSGTKKEEEKK